MSFPGYEQLGEILPRVTTPSHIEIVRAKRLILETAAGGHPIGIDVLQAVLVQADGVRRPDAMNGKLVFGRVDDIDEKQLRDRTIIRWVRSKRAGAEAVVDLQSRGLLVEASLAAGESAHAIVRSTETIEVKIRNAAGGVDHAR